jgi:uncharacterized Zn finger protein (UPF0148 family)
MKIECPNCHTLFRVVTVEKELVQDEKAEDIKDTRGEKAEEALEFLNPFTVAPVAGSKGRDVGVDDLTYEYHYRCKHCGYEWTELKEKEKIDKS